MRNSTIWLLSISCCLLGRHALAQEVFKQFTDEIKPAFRTDLKEDKQGFLWMAEWNYETQEPEVERFDGTSAKKYVNNPKDPHSISKSTPLALFIDDDNNVWIAYYGMGVDKLDPATDLVTHFRHRPGDSTSLSCDTVYCLSQDTDGHIWIGTFRGLNILDTKAGTFEHYFRHPEDPRTIRSNCIFTVFRDHEGTMWVGTGNLIASAPPDEINDGGLSRYDPRTNTFTSYVHSDRDPQSLSANKVLSISEDREGRLWIGTSGNGLDRWDKHTGLATHFGYDNFGTHPVVLAPQETTFPAHVTFVKEDGNGVLWIGSLFGGINRYDTLNRRITHYGTSYSAGPTDTTRGYRDFSAIHAVLDRNGLLWVISNSGHLYSVVTKPSGIPFVPLDGNGNAFYQEPGGKVLWIGTSKGLLRKDLASGVTKMWVNDPIKKNGLPPGPVTAIKPDEKGMIWISTIGGGVCRLNPLDQTFLNFRHDESDPGSLRNDSARNLIFGHHHNLWIPFWGEGLDMMDLNTHRFTHYPYSPLRPDPKGLKIGTVETVYEDEAGTVWVGDALGLSRLDRATGTFHYYPLPPNCNVFTMLTDAVGVFWIGTRSGLYRYDKRHDRFLPFYNPGTNEPIAVITGMQEDDDHNLWMRTAWEIVRLNRRRDSVQMFGPGYGVKSNYEWISRFTKGKGGELYFGTLGGYFDFFPENVHHLLPPVLSITQITLGNQGQGEPLPAGVLDSPLFRATEANLAYSQNSFTVHFDAIHNSKPGPIHYQVMLDNYDHNWVDPGRDGQMAFYSVPPGKYLLHIKATDADGDIAQKTLVVIVHPPWYRTWWAYTLFGILFITAVWAFIDYRGRNLIRTNKALEEKVNDRTLQLKQSLEELRAAQRQLIQSEKMASLGELTAGIAHEIQNPLNFVNNFSEINNELIEEMKQELQAGHTEEALTLAQDIQENEEKINAHGKRADAIVKGMLLHSRTSSGQKEATDINALADEYLRLSYHGLRAKDKTFNATMLTDFDPSIGLIETVPQDIGRVLLNMFTNAFYSVSEKRKKSDNSYEPAVSVRTKKLGAILEIRIRDNGLGVPQQIVDKIFQPFFTTKAAGVGTGLGLSLSYDIVVKGHGGKLTIDTKEGEYAEFLITLPG